MSTFDPVRTAEITTFEPVKNVEIQDIHRDSGWIFEKYVAFGALLTYVFAFFVFFTF